MRSKNIKLLLIAFSAFWLSAIILCFKWQMAYGLKAGDKGKIPLEWPVITKIKHKPSSPILLMFLHPKCDCSRASLDELLKLVSKLEHKPEIKLVFYNPGNSKNWEDTYNIRIAKDIPGTEIIFDDFSQIASTFGAHTSGQIMLYDSGKLIFEGGITSMRGQVGVNAGSLALLDYLNKKQTGQKSTNVFGCGIKNI